MLTQGYIQCHRKITKHWLWEERRVFSPFEAWMDLLMRARFAQGIVIWSGQKVFVRRGEMLVTQGQLMKAWGWSNSKVRGFLKRLETDTMIHLITDRSKTRIHICNYNQYQNISSS